MGVDLDSESWEVDFFPFVSETPGGEVVLEELPIHRGTRGDSEDPGEAGEPVAAPGALRWLGRPRGCGPEGRMSRGQGCGTQRRSRRGRWGCPRNKGRLCGNPGSEGERTGRRKEKEASLRETCEAQYLASYLCGQMRRWSLLTRKSDSFGGKS